MFQSRKLDLMATVTTAHTKTSISKMYFYHLCNKHSWKYATIIANMAVLLNSNMATPLIEALKYLIADSSVSCSTLSFKTHDCATTVGQKSVTYKLQYYYIYFWIGSLVFHCLSMSCSWHEHFAMTRKRKTILKLLTSSNSNCKYLFHPPDFTKYKKPIHHSSTTLFYHNRAIKGVKYAMILQYVDKKLKAGQTEGS